MSEIIELLRTYWNGSNIIALVLLLSVFIEISPIKFNPLQWISNIIQKNMNHRLDTICNKLESFSERIDKIEINNMRSAILSFGNSCMRNERHTQEEFSHILAIYDRYEKIIEESDISNGQVDISIEYIKDVYRDCLKNNNFLKESYGRKDQKEPYED